MRLDSSEFADSGTLPQRFAAARANISPPFHWGDAPANTKSFAMICEDADMPLGERLLWAIYNIPEDMHALPENASLTYANSDDIYQGLNDAGVVGYLGPNPPGNESHRYRFRLLAISEKTHLPAGIPDWEILERIQPYVSAESVITGLYAGNS
jgi:Raf kinase inhibitor-like YbhB/YbcL family protein